MRRIALLLSIMFCFSMLSQEKQNIQQPDANSAIEALSPGMDAPDFSLPQMNGEMLALSDLRGKWVLLDFWGSWCYW